MGNLGAEGEKDNFDSLPKILQLKNPSIQESSRYYLRSRYRDRDGQKLKLGLMLKYRGRKS